MALLYPTTTLVPSKLEVLAAWLPSQPWFTGDATKIERVAGYRLDDPEGKVGLDGIFVRAGEEIVYHVPLSYRDAPLEESEEFFVGTMEHGVLGTRWVTAAAGDPVYRAVIAQTIAQGGSGAAETLQNEDGTVSEREITVPLRGSGEPGAPVPELWAAEVAVAGGATVASTGLATLRIIHTPGSSAEARGASQTLTARWPGQDEPVIIATLD